MNPSASRSRSRLAGPLVALLTLVAVAVIADLLLLAVAPVPDPHERLLQTFPRVNQYIRMEFPRDFHATTIPEPGLPGMEGTTHFSTNNMGFRGDSLITPKPAGEFRVFMVGGSTTECFYLDDHDAINAVVQRELEKLSPQLHARVYGVGNSGAASDDHVAVIANRLVHLQPDLVVVFCGINDLARAAVGFDYLHYTDHYPPLHIPRWKHLLLSSQIVRRIFYLRTRIDPTDVEIQQSMTKTTNYGTKVALERSAPETNEPPRTDLDSYRRNLESMVGLARVHGFDLIFMTQQTTWDSSVDKNAAAWHWMRYRDGKTYSESAMNAAMERYNETMREVAQQDSVGLFDTARVIPKSLEYFYDDCHFNPRGASEAGVGLARLIAAREATVR